MGDSMEVLDCGHPPSEHSSFTTGYGTFNGKRHCYDCCANNEKKWMIEKGRTALYLMQYDDKPWEVTDWSGKLRFKVTSRRVGRHNWGLKRYDVWFTGPDGRLWWGVQYGDNTQLVHCKATRT